MEFNQSSQKPQHLAYLSRNIFPGKPFLNPQNQNIYPSQSSLLSAQSSPAIVFHPKNTFNNFQDRIKNVSTHNHAFVMESHSSHTTIPFRGFVNINHHHPHPMMLPSTPTMYALEKVMWNFSQNTMFHSSEASSSKSSPSLSLSNDNGFTMNELHPDINRMQQNKKVEMDADIIKRKWTPEEDSSLDKLVNQFGLKKWSEISKLLPGRIGKQCRERWYNHLQPNIKTESWSLEEDMVLIKCHQEYGNKWSLIAKMLPGRPENTIKNHWNASKRRQSSQTQNKNPYYDGSILHSYIKRVTAAQEPTKVLNKSITKNNKKKKKKKVLTCTCDELALFLSNGRCSHDGTNKN